MFNIFYPWAQRYQSNKQRLGPPVPKPRQFSDLFPWARVLKWGRKREKQWKRGLSITIRFIVQGWNATNFDGKTLIKPNKWQTGLFQPSKVSLNFSLTKLLNMFLQLFSEIVKLTEKLSAKFKKNCYINILFLHKCKKMLEYQNFKKFYSIVLMGLVGSHYGMGQLWLPR